MVSKTERRKRYLAILIDIMSREEDSQKYKAIVDMIFG
jgi:hypothetical protein